MVVGSHGNSILSVLRGKTMSDTPRYSPDSHHYSNWCRICGLYYCWHDEAPTHPRDYRAKGHPFTPFRNENDYPVKREHDQDDE
jgi:hypothetical protein